ncbi:hypothetical protein RUND412_003672 [Rhizina undulata]
MWKTTLRRPSTVDSHHNQVDNSGNKNTNSHNQLNFNDCTFNEASHSIETDRFTQVDDASAYLRYSQDFKVGAKQIPFHPNPNFCGREDIFGKLRDILKPSDLVQNHSILNTPDPESNTKRKTAVLHGIGDIGKSQIALKYAHDFGDCYTSTFWIDAYDSSSTMESACQVVEQIVAHYVSKSPSAPDFLAISNILGIPGKIGHIDSSAGGIDPSATNLALQAVHTWLAAEKNRRWLLVVDNYDKGKEDRLKKIIPKCNWGIPKFHGIGTCVEVEKLAMDEGCKLLNGSLEVKDSERSEAENIVAALEGLQLALEQARAYMCSQQISFSNYRTILEKSTESLFEKSIDDSSSLKSHMPRKSIKTTWELSFQELSDDARQLLELCAFLSSKDIPEELFHRGNIAMDGNLKENAADKKRLCNAIENLFTFSLAKRKHGESSSFCIHPLVHDWARLRQGADTEKQRQNAKNAISMVISTLVPINKKSSDNWLFERRILRHLKICQNNIRYFSESHKAAEVLSTIGSTYEDLGFFRRARKSYQRALKGQEKALGTEHPETLTTVRNIASVLENQGRYNKALELYERVLEGQEKVLGKGHPTTLITVHNMASVFDNLGLYDKALEFYLRVLARNEETLGKDHPSTLTTVQTIASACDDLGRYNEAMDWYQRALKGKEKALGKDHLSTLTTVHNMASVFDNLGQYNQALDFYDRALMGRERELGSDHSSTLATIHNMASVFYHQGKYDKALELYRRVLVWEEKALGKDHLSTLTTVHNMASVFYDQGRYVTALKWYERALEGKETTFGKDHPSTLTTVHCMASVFDSQGRYNQALEWSERALSVREKTLGKDHPSTLTTVHNMGSVIIWESTTR